MRLNNRNNPQRGDRQLSGLSARPVLALRCRVIDAKDGTVLSERNLEPATNYGRLTYWAADGAKILRVALKHRCEEIAKQIVGELMDLAEN